MRFTPLLTAPATVAPPFTWTTPPRRASAPRRLAIAIAVLIIASGVLSLMGWAPGAHSLLLETEAYTAPRPSRGLLILLNGTLLLLLATKRLRRARQIAWASLAAGIFALGLTLLGLAVPVDAALMPATTPGRGLLSIALVALSLTVPAAGLQLARVRLSDVRTLVVTALAMMLVGGAVLLAIVHGAELGLTPNAPAGPLSLAGLATAVLMGITLFLLVADRQAAPRVPPRWSPEMAATLSTACALALWRMLQTRAEPHDAYDAVMPTLVLLLGLLVSSLLYFTLRLLRSNWLQAQRIAHANLSEAFESASDGVWEYDFGTRLVRRSVKQLRHLGYEPDIVNRTAGAWLSLVHPDDRPQVEAQEAERKQSRQEHGEVSYRVRAADGAYHTIIDRGRVVERDASGAPKLIMGLSADVTELERVDRERRENERRFRAIFDSALQGQVLLDEFGTCLEVNGTALAIVGARREDVVQMPFVLGPWFTGLTETQTQIDRALEEMSGGTPMRFELETHLLDGRLGRLECSMTPLRCDEGRVHQVLCEMRDVTDRRRSEEALREIGALTTIGRLAARVAHEINNPLAGIQNAFLLLGDAVPESHPHRRFLASIDREIQRIASVTRSLYETYRQDGPPGASGSMALAVHDAVTFLDQVNRSRNIRIRTDLRRAPALVPVPDALLRQTLYNLVQNAVEASPVGGEVSIVVEAVGDECIITVGDEGARVPDHLRERIFEPMSGARTSQLRTGSMGIGLSLVRQSVRALGGTVTLLDEPQHGATFEVRLPMTSVIDETSGPIVRPTALRGASSRGAVTSAPAANDQVSVVS